MDTDNSVPKFGHNVRKWFESYVGFCKAAIFMMGLVFSYSLVEYGFVFIIITYFADILEATLPKAVKLTNMNEGLTAMMMMLNAHIADAYVGRFAMVIFSTVSYCIGIILLYILELNRHRKAKNLLLFMGLVLIAQGGANRKPTFKAFFADQFEFKDDNVNEMENNEDNNNESRAEFRAKVWWGCFSFLGIIIGTFCISMSNMTWAEIYKISALAMGISCFVCFCGFPYYNYRKPTGSPFTVVCPVFVAAALKCRFDYPLDSSQFFEKVGNVCRFPRTLRLRYLDKAAIIDASSHYTEEEQEKKWRLCTVTQVEETKLLLGMCPLWSTLLVYSLVKSTGNTFFIEQASYLNPSMGNIKFPLSGFLLIMFLSMIGVSNLYDRLSRKLTGSHQKHMKTKVRVGLGMLSSIICCMIAWLVEVRRLGIVKTYDLVDNPDVFVPMSIFWLVPQYFMLGAMVGLAEDGIHNFFYYIAPKSMKNYGPAISDCVLGFGNFLSVICVYGSRSWFGDTLNQSRLDKYYMMLTILSFLNLLLYLKISPKYEHPGPAVEKEQPTIEEAALEEIQGVAPSNFIQERQMEPPII